VGRRSDATPVATLLDLIGIESDSRQELQRISDYARVWCQEIGLDVNRYGDPSLPALCATNGSGGIILSGHLDTVPVGANWTVPQGEVVAGRIYGRGAADMKGGVTAMLHAARELRKADLPFSVFLTTDEEDRMTGAEALSELDLVKEAKGILICEPTNLKPAYREKGISRFRLTTHGRAAHASMTWLGDNAIQRMSKLLEGLSWLAQTPDSPTDDMTLCISLIKGGIKPNVVPDRCEVEIDARFPMPLTYRKVRTTIMDELAGQSYDIQMLYELEAFEADPSTDFALTARDIAGSELVTMPFATEAPWYAAYNKNVLIWGPGSEMMAHAADEFVERWQIERAVELYQHMAKRCA
jgi:acetylornithine deacetylase/succinyl-diaminopimelate desuccinylase-like protein